MHTENTHIHIVRRYKIVLAKLVLIIYHSTMEINVSKLKREMKRSGYKDSAAFSKALPITRQAIDFILARRTTTFKTLNTIADALGCDGKDLLI